MAIYREKFDSPGGTLQIVSDGERLISVNLFGDTCSANPCRVTGEAILQLRQYFQGSRKEFNLPLQIEGGDFQMSVLRVLQNIPYGETRTYGQIADAVARPGSARAVGNALNRNPLPIILPCHRVIRADGTTGGYAGGSAMKRFLLESESRDILVR